MKKQLAIAFALGLLVGILIWSDDDEAPDTGKQVATRPAADAGARHAPDPPRFGSYAPRHTPPPQQPGYSSRYDAPGGAGSPPQWGRAGSDPRLSGQSSTPPPAASPYPGGDYSQPYTFAPSTKPTQPWAAPGYRFRPADQAQPERNRYSGEYPSVAPPKYAPRPSDRDGQPSYQQWQPTPGYDERLPYSQSPPPDLYSVR